MRSRLVWRAALVLIVGSVFVLHSYSTPRQVYAETVTVAGAALSVPIGTNTVILAAQSAYTLFKLAREATTGSDSVSIKIDIEGDTLKLDLGMTATIPFEMEYFFDDTWKPNENVWATIHIVVDDKLAYYKRIPEDGFFHDPTPGALSGGEGFQFFQDDSAQGRIKGQIEIGARQYDPSLQAVTVTAHADLWKVFGHHSDAGRRSVHADASNFENYFIRLRDGGYTIGNPLGSSPELALMSDRVRELREQLRAFNHLNPRHDARPRAAPSKASFRVLVWNPYYVEVPCSSKGAREEHGTIFEHCITARMNYADTPGGVRVTTPEPAHALVKLEGFDSTCDGADAADCWSFDVPEREFRMGPIKIEASGSKDIKITGQHVKEDHDEGVVSYSTEWALSVKGTNRLIYEKAGSPGKFGIEPYEWGAPFRAEPIQPALLAAPLTQFRVLDVPAKEPFPGWERNVTLDATLTNGCPAAPLGFTKEILIQVEGAPADAESAIITFWDGRQASRGQISTTTGEFTVPSGYHGVLTPELNETIARTIDIQGCTAEFVVEVRPH